MDFSSLEKTLNYTFKSRTLLLEAITHKSLKKPYNNERLEFLGDAVLDLLVGEFLFHKFSNSKEGELSKMRASLVNEKSFALLANSLNLGSFIQLSYSEEQNNGRKKASILSDAFEALMGAIYLEKGLEQVRKIALPLLEKNFPDISQSGLFCDYKTSLQEVTQAIYGITPEYVLFNSTGPDHNKEFTMGVFICGKEYAQAKGKTKKEAQQKCANIALQILQKEQGNKA